MEMRPRSARHRDTLALPSRDAFVLAWNYASASAWDFTIEVQGCVWEGSGRAEEGRGLEYECHLFMR